MSTTAVGARRRRVRRLYARPVELAAGNPVFVVGAIVALWALVLAFYTTQVSEWLVMTDELQYVKLGQSIADTGNPLPAIRGEAYAAYNQLYPLLISPLLGLLDMPAAFRAIHVLNALLFASTAIPGYLLGRAVGLGRGPSYLVGALCVLIPWTALSIMVMTENAAYPAFVWAILAIQRTVAQPSPRRDLLAIAAIAVAALARTQFLLLAGILPAAVLAHEAGWRLTARGTAAQAPPLRVAVRERAVLVAASLAGAALLAAVAAAGRLADLLGSYRATLEQGELLPAGIWQSAEIHLAHVAVGVGVVPVVLALAWAATTLVRPLSRAEHALAVLGLLLVPLLAVQVASFNMRFAGGNIQTRYLFYICPLLFAGMVAALSGGRRLWLPSVAAAVVVFVLIDLGAYLTALGPFFSAPETAFYKLLDGRSYQTGLSLLGRPLRGTETVPWAALAAGLAAAAALRILSRRAAILAVGLLLCGGLAFETRYVIRAMLGPNGERLVTGTSLDGRDWVDRALPGGRRAAALPLPFNAFEGKPEDRAYYSQQTWWDVEFWNKSIDRVYDPGGFRFTVFHTLPFEVDPRTGRVRAADQRPYLATSGSGLRYGLAGRVVAQERDGHVELIEADLPYAAAWTVTGLDDTGWTGETPARLRLFARAGRPVLHSVELHLEAPGDAVARAYRLDGPDGDQTGVVRGGEQASARFSICVRRPVDLRLRVPERSTLPDGRRIGLRVRRLRDTLGAC